MLAVSDLEVYYGQSRVLQGVSLEVASGEAVALLGPNGAGKTTVLKTIAGLLKPRAGYVSFEGQVISRLRPEAVVRRGVALVPEGRRLFPDMSVLENLMLGGYSQPGDGSVKQNLEYFFERFPMLSEKRHTRAKELSGGQQQLVAIARGLMSRPRLLLLDEPSLGLAPLMVKEIELLIASVQAEFKMSVLLIEQNVAMALHVATKGYVLHHGTIVLQGPSEQLLSTDIVREAYMGGIAARKD